MSVATQPHPALRWDGRRLAILDQTRLPGAEVWLALEGAADTAQAIRRLAVRGAPLIGVAAAYGLAMEVARQPGLGTLEAGWELLRAARPTAVNLAYAVDRVRAAALAAGPPTMAAARRARRPSASTPRRTPPRRPSPPTAPTCWRARRGIATHCNTGALAAGGRGTALAVILALHERGAVHVLAGETRPLLQGARLTVWELARAGVSHELVVDGAMAGLIRRGEVDAVDRRLPTASPPTATPPTRSAPIPWPWPPPRPASRSSSPPRRRPSTPGCPTATASRSRSATATRCAPSAASQTTLPGTAVRNPAFDVTPAALITALVTERGVARPPDAASIAALLA